MEISKEGQEYLALLDPNISPVLLFVDYNVDDSEYNTDGEDYSIDDEGEELDHASDDSLDEDINEDAEDEEDGKLGEVDDRCEEDNEGCDEDVGPDEVTDNDDQEEDDTVFFYSIAKRQLMSKRVEEFNTHFYWTTPQGWLLMVHPESHKVFLWSPFIDQRINLPFDEDGFFTNNTVRCLLSHRPTDSNCVVLVVNCRKTIFWYCHPQGHIWFKHEYQSSIISTRESHKDVIKTMKLLTTIKGRFYTYLCKDKAIVTLEFLPKPTFRTTPVEDAPNPSYWSIYTSYFLESCGDLFMLSYKHPVLCSQKVSQIEVHKLDLSRRIWVKVSTIGNMAFFVDSTDSGVSASLNAEDVGLKRNCIYFVRPNDKGLHIYDIERGTTSIHNPGVDLADYLTPDIMMTPLS
uniref:KIB1-4 beta-propeller domain-containing protein n=1 Tax=Oryza meridionalis TaxID=40149 RepID=A0A0E0ERT2_9ORYZ